MANASHYKLISSDNIQLPQTRRCYYGWLHFNVYHPHQKVVLVSVCDIHTETNNLRALIFTKSHRLCCLPWNALLLYVRYVSYTLFTLLGPLHSLSSYSAHAKTESELERRDWNRSHSRLTSNIHRSPLYIHSLNSGSEVQFGVCLSAVRTTHSDYLRISFRSDTLH